MRSWTGVRLEGRLVALEPLDEAHEDGLWAASREPETWRWMSIVQPASRDELRALLDAELGGRSLGTLRAGKNAYRVEEQTSNEVAIRSDLLRAEDLFVIADQFRGRTVYLEVIVNPLVNLIWLAGVVFLVGSLVTLWPDAREQRRLARRFGEAGGALARA